jgi:hypothetical protein
MKKLVLIGLLLLAPGCAAFYADVATAETYAHAAALDLQKAVAAYKSAPTQNGIAAIQSAAKALSTKAGTIGSLAAQVNAGVQRLQNGSATIDEVEALAAGVEAYTAPKASQ